MRKNPYLKYLLCQAITLPVVILLFRLIPDRKVASMFASTVFIGLSLGLFTLEFKSSKWSAKTFWVTGAIFFLFFALPIFLLRVTNWNQDFSEISLGPVRASALHGVSNLSFMLWMLASAFEGYRYHQIKKAH